MSKLVNFTTLEINKIVDNLEKVFDGSVVDTELQLTKHFVYQTTYNNVSITPYNCYLGDKKEVTKTMDEYITVENTVGSLSKLPFNILSITPLVIIETVDGAGMSYEYSISGTQIQFKNISYAILQISYTYKEVEVEVKSNDVGVAAIINGTSPAALLIECEDNFKDVYTFDFSFEKPALECEVIDDYILTKTAATLNDAKISCHIYNGKLTKQETSFQEVTETVTFTDGVGQTQFNISTVINYEFVEGDRGVVKKKASTGLYDNYLSLTPSGVGATITPSGTYNVTYITKIIRFYWTLYGESGSYVIEDVFLNKCSGVLESDTIKETKDIDIKVVDYLTREPLNNAIVTIKNITAVTGVDGVAKLKGVPVGRQKVIIHKDGYITNIADNLANEYIDV